jgi:hypothetical protein
VTTFATPTPEITRDRYGRPLIVPKNGEKPQAYTRCTTFVSAFEDTYNLEQWKVRQAAIGLSLRPDLALAVAAHKDDKKRLNAICQEALDAAASSAGATTGTALHALSEQMDRGQKLPVLPAESAADLAAYAQATAEFKAVHIEQLMVFDRWKVAGTPDRVVEYRGKRYIADLKTGDITWGAGKIAAQLAMYARSEVYDVANPKARELHGAEVDKGLVIHLPAGTGTCEVVWVDLLAGWEIARTCYDVREKRKLKADTLYAPLDGAFAKATPTATPLSSALGNITAARTPLEQVTQASTRAELEALWAAYSRDGVWTDEMTEAAKRRTQELPTAS